MIKQLLFFVLISVCYSKRLLKELDFGNDTLNLSVPILEPTLPILELILSTLKPQPRININEIEI